MRLEGPLDAGFVDELFRFWAEIFGGPMDVPPEVFLGHENEHNRSTVYLERRGQRLVGTSAVTASRKLPVLSGFGGVASSPEVRRLGVSSRLCRQAVDDFRDRGGHALFLGTDNPEAARVFYRLGWRRLASTNVMVNISDGSSPEAFLLDYFRDLGPATVRPATPADRIPMIPLLVSPHDWQVLDANAAMFSTRYALQPSCMGLYRRYSSLARDHRGGWFSAVAEGGMTVGLSTARLHNMGSCQVDGFTYRDQPACWNELIQGAIDWGNDRGASSFNAEVSVEDEEKQALFESAGFRSAGPGEPFVLDGRKVAAARFERERG